MHRISRAFDLLLDKSRHTVWLGSLTIRGSLKSGGDNVTIVVTDMLGQSVYSNSVFAGSGNLNERVDLANNIASGMYLVTVTSGEHHVVFHVVVDK